MKQIVVKNKYFLLFNSFSIFVLLLSGHWCTQCLPSCQSPTSSAWSSPWRHTPTFITSTWGKDKVRITVTCSHADESVCVCVCSVQLWSLCVCVCSRPSPWSRGPLVPVEVSGHPHHGHRAHVSVRRPGHSAHPAHPEPAQRLPGQDVCLSSPSGGFCSALFLAPEMLMVGFSSPRSISSGWRFSLWYLRSQRLLTASSLPSRTT